MPLGRLHSIRQKIFIGVFAIVLTGLLVSGISMVVYDARSYHQGWVEDLTAQAEVLGRATAPGLQFNDPKFASENLILLRVKPMILGATIYNAHGQLFASYVQPGQKEADLPAVPGTLGVHVTGPYMELFHPIVENDEQVGTIYLRGRYELVNRMLTYVGTVLAVSMIALLVSLALAWWLQREISSPIVAIADLARRVVERRDYTLRATKISQDEVGYLVDAFNDMLIEINHSTQALEKSNRELAHGMIERKRLEERFRQVVESAPNAMVMINQKGRIMMVNAQTERIFGYPREELLGHTVELLLPERFRGQHPGLRTSFFNAPSPRAMGAGRDLYGRRKDGSEFPVEIGLNPIETDEGPMVLSAVVDISLRKKLEERFRRVVESAPYAMVMIDQTGTIRMINTQTERIFGYARDELLGQSIDILVPGQVRPHHPQLRSRFFADPKSCTIGIEREIHAVRKSGDEFPVEISLNPIETDEGLMALSAIVDVSERVKAAHRLTRHATELERSNKELDTFAYVASHDLKSPLRGISQLASWIAEDMHDTLTPEVENHLRLMRSRINRMERLLDDLLAYSRVGRVKSSMGLVKSAETAREIFALIAPPAGFTLDLADNLPVFTTVVAPFEQVMRNLLVNAVKHHDRQEGHIEISVTVKGDDYEFSVRDDGPGIPPQFHDRVFNMFQTLKPRDEIEGSGMGLAFVKKTVETYGGVITLESDGVRGTVFHFTWPTEAKLGRTLHEHGST